MSELTVYANPNFQGDFFGFGPGDYLVNNLQTAGPIDFNDKISSVRVGQNVVVEMFNNSAFRSGTAVDSSRVVVGPAEIANLNSLGNFDKKISALRVRRIKMENSYVANPQRVTIADQYSLGGRTGALGPGKYNMQRLTSAEYKFTDNSIRSIDVPPYLLVILYDADNFDNTKNAIAVIGPQRIDNLDDIGMSGLISSIAVYGLENPDVEAQVTSSNLPAPTSMMGAALMNQADTASGAVVGPYGATSYTNLSQNALNSSAAAWQQGAVTEHKGASVIGIPVPGLYGQSGGSGDLSLSTKLILLFILVVLVAIAIMMFRGRAASTINDDKIKN